MKIERGILVVNDNANLLVRAPMQLYNLSTTSMWEIETKIGGKLLSVIGVIVDKKFCICNEYKLKDGKTLYGYITNNDFTNNIVRIQTINGFDLKNFDPYNSDYVLGEVIEVKKDDII